MEAIQLSYAKLRNTTQQIQRLVREATGVNSFTMKSALEDELSITGDDAVYLLVQLEERFGVDWRELEFDRYFSPEGFTGGAVTSLLGLPLLAGLLTFFSGQLLLALLVWPFSTEQAEWLVNFSLQEEISRRARRIWPRLVKPPAATFNVGDLVASAVAGRFVKRERVRFVLV